jgi:hypothetical protein
MLALTEDKLEAQGVTKGARHKIILSIKRLKERYNNLCQLEKVSEWLWRVMMGLLVDRR